MNDKELDKILDDLNLRHFVKGRQDLLPELLIPRKQLQSLLKQAELRGRVESLKIVIQRHQEIEAGGKVKPIPLLIVANLINELESELSKDQEGEEE